MKYSSYEVHHFNRRADGRIEPAGIEFLVLSPEDVYELSWSALVVSMDEGIEGSRTVVFEGEHCQFDAHLGWFS